MSNILKDVFSKKMFEMGLNLQFRDVESKAEFEKAMETAFEEGRPVEITGVSAINTSIKARQSIWFIRIQLTEALEKSSCILIMNA